MAHITDLVGETLKKVERIGDERIVFYPLVGNRNLILHHDQDYYESVYIEDVCGDLDDLVGLPVFMAEEVICESFTPDWAGKVENYDNETFTWTF